MMRTELFWPLAFCGFAAVSLVCGIVAWPPLSAAWPSIEEKIDQFRRQPPFVKLVLLLFVGAFVVYGSTKTNLVDQTSGTNIVEIVEGGTNGIEIAESRTNDVDQVGLQNAEAAAQGGDLSQGGSGVLAACHEGRFRFSTSGEDAASPLTVTDTDIARGWQLWEVRTNCTITYAMPEDATLATHWWVRGAYEDVKPIDFGSWRFPFGTNEYSSLWAFTWGKARFALGDAETEIVAVGSPMSAVPYRSRLWSAADTNGARVVTWENFVLGRALKEDVDSLTSGETPLPLCSPLPLCCAQIELRSTGDFIVRSNEVEKVYRRVDPEDWDGDGWRNDDDYNPHVWEEFGDWFWQELPEGANESAYYWVDVRPRWNSWIEFYGDAPSNLDDPRIYGKAGETYRVRLLIGKTYDVESSRPFDIVAKSDERIAVSEIGAGQCEIVWPVEFTVAAGRAPGSRPRLGATWNDGGKSFYVMPNPDWLRGDIVWYGACCDVWGDGTNFTYACNGNCTCTGCAVYGDYLYEGYGLTVNGIPCGCHYVPDHGPFEVMQFGFDKSAAIYEDAYTNMPGVVVHPTPSNVVLRCKAYGGTYGGRLTIALNAAGRSKIARVGGNLLPNSVEIPPDTTRVFETEYTPLEPSGTVNDIVATATYVENFRNGSHTATATLTAIRLQLEAVYDAPENHNPSRHVYGVGEKVRFKVTPVVPGGTLHVVKADSGDIVTDYDTFEGNLEIALAAENLYRCPATDTRPDVTLRYMGVEYRPLMTAVEPQSVEALSVSREGTFSPGDVCMGVMVSRVYVKPFTVSFSGVQIYEVPCTNAIPPTGYFAMTNIYMGPKTHVYPNAGYLHIPDKDNYVMTDRAGRTDPYPNWSAGTLTWKVPIGWRRILRGYEDQLAALEVDYALSDNKESRPLLIGGREGSYTQTFKIEANGTSSIRKFGYKLERDRWLPFGTVSQTGEN